MRKYILKSKWKFLLIILLIAARQVLLIFSTILNADAITVLTKYNFNDFLLIILKLALVWLAIIIIDKINTMKQEIFSQEIGLLIREDISNSMISMNVEDFKKNSTGVYQSWLNNDIVSIQNKGVKNIFILASKFFGVIFSVTALFSYHYSILIITLIGTVSLMLVPKLMNKRIQEVNSVVTRENEVFMSDLEEILMGHNTFMVLNVLREIPNRIKKASKRLIDKVMLQTGLETDSYMINFGLNVFFQVAIMFATGYLVLKGKVELGIMTSTGIFANIIFEGMSQISYKVTSIIGMASIFDKFDNFHKLCQQETTSSGEVKLSESVFQCKDLNFFYDGKQIFDNYNLVIEKGKKYLISGDSGCGKSTLLKLLTGQLSKFSGEINFFGADIRSVSSYKLYEYINFIEQKPFILSGTIRDNLSLEKSYADEDLISHLNLVGFPCTTGILDKDVGNFGEFLSGGEKQKIILARALLNNRKILLIDEGLASLDLPSAMEIERYLLNCKDLTLLMISHTTKEEIRKLFDCIIKF